MSDEEKLREYIRKTINESASNFLKAQAETNTKQLKNDSKSESLGDPLDVKLNQQADELGSDGKNAPTVSVKAGATKGGSEFTSGQKQANFSDKTKQAQ